MLLFVGINLNCLIGSNCLAMEFIKTTIISGAPLVPFEWLAWWTKQLLTFFINTYNLVKCLMNRRAVDFVLLSCIIFLFSCSSADEDEIPNASNEDMIDVGLTRRYRSQRRDELSPGVVRSTVKPLLEPVSRPTFINLLFDAHNTGSSYVNIFNYSFMELV